jgi:hypothetical protein
MGLFEVPTISGFSLNIGGKVMESTILSCSMDLPPSEVSFRSGPAGLQQVIHGRRSLQLILDRVSSNSNWSIGLGNKSFVKLALRPYEKLAFDGRLSYRKQNSLELNLGATISRELAALEFRFKNQTAKFELIFGIPEMRFGISKSWGATRNTVLMVTSVMNQWNAQILTEMEKQSVLFRLEKSIFMDSKKTFLKNDVNGVIATQIQIGKDARAVGTLTWKLNIRDYIVHSSVSSSGIVRSHLCTGITANCRVMTSIELRHSEAQSNYGLSLNFFPRR